MSQLRLFLQYKEQMLKGTHYVFIVSHLLTTYCRISKERSNAEHRSLTMIYNAIFNLTTFGFVKISLRMSEGMHIALAIVSTS